MSSRTKIVVLHMKEIIYTAVFAALGILLIFLLIFMFRPSDRAARSETQKQYTPGIYTSSLTLNNTDLEVEVTVDETHITGIRFSNLDETVMTMYPLIQPAIETLSEQICTTQSLDGISLPDDSPYTSKMILDAVRTAIEKAAVN